MKEASKFKVKCVRHPFTIFSVFILLLFAGCRSIMPPGNGTQGLRLGPFFETATDDNGASMVAMRPFYSRETASPTDPTSKSKTDVLWPLGTYSTRNNRFYWRALLFYGTGTMDDPTSPGDPYRFRLFPFFFVGKTSGGDDYGAIFPLGGKLRDFFFYDELDFCLFPIYAKGKTKSTEMTTYLWPFYLKREGENFSQRRFFPFYGTKERLHYGRLMAKSEFIAWPFWTSFNVTDTSDGSSIGDGFVFWPFYGYSDTKSDSENTRIKMRTFLPPFFLFAGDGKDYEKVFAPWPFYRHISEGNHIENHYWPFYGSNQRKGVKDSKTIDSTTEYYLWPLFRATSVNTDDKIRENYYHAPLPFYFHHSRIISKKDGDERSVYSRLWPLFSYRNSPSGTHFRFPEFSLWSKSEAIERNWAPLWSLYTFREKEDGAYLNDLLWGFLSWGRNDRGERTFSLFWIPILR